MVTGLRGSALFDGYRGSPGVDQDGLVQVLHRVSRLVEDMPEVAELDCNPVIATPGGVLVVDARIRVSLGTTRTDVEDIRYLR
jgi:acyl-CoA synthetase (NDP forming)